MIKRIIHLGLASATISFLFYVNCEREKSASVHFHYTDPQFSFRISYPITGWTLNDRTGIPDVLVVLRSETTVEEFIPNVTIAVAHLSRMMNATEYGEKNREDLVAHGYEVFSPGKTVINHNTFFDLQCVNRYVGVVLRFRQLCLVKNRVGFIITCTAPDEHYSDFTRDFEFIVKSFRFL